MSSACLDSRRLALPGTPESTDHMDVGNTSHMHTRLNPDGSHHFRKDCGTTGFQKHY